MPEFKGQQVKEVDGSRHPPKHPITGREIMSHTSGIVLANDKGLKSTQVLKDDVIVNDETVARLVDQAPDTGAGNDEVLVADRIDLHLDGGTAVIARLLAGGEAGTFDLAFIDADKSGYDSYYEGALKLLRPGGLVLVDNTLWDGDVADPAKQDADTRAIRALNDKMLADPRVEICLVPICDGLTMARKL